MTNKKQIFGVLLMKNNKKKIFGVVLLMKSIMWALNNTPLY